MTRQKKMFDQNHRRSRNACNFILPFNSIYEKDVNPRNWSKWKTNPLKGRMSEHDGTE